ncbi:MAG: hypothetical protein IKC66_08545 [Alistipes sp.]|nr:hypothetical protein [Alistipes sp.]
MAKKRVVRHRIFDLTITLIIIVAVTTLRAVMMPAGDELMPNTDTPIGAILQNLQGSVPTLSALIWAVVLFFASMGAGSYGTQYSLYPAYTLMAIPIVAITAAAIMVSGEMLLSAAALVIMMLATKYIHRFVMRSDSFSDLSLAMLYYGLLPLVVAPTALLYAAMPLLVLIVRSSWRHWVVCTSSLAFPLLSVSYWSWCAGEGFLTPIDELYTSMLTPSEFSFFSTINPAGIILLGVLIVMSLCSITLIISDKYSLKVRSRAMMRFNALLLLTSVGMFFLPSATATLFAIVAMPAAMLIPLIFVRMGVRFTEMLYRLMLLAAAANMVLLSVM